MRLDMELRKLSLSNIAHILEIDDDWQKIAKLIPKNLQDIGKSKDVELKYNCEHIKLMEKHAGDTNRMKAEVLLDEWGTSGRVRPTLDILMQLLLEANLLRAGDKIAEMMGVPPLPRPTDGPGAPIATNLSEILNDESVRQRLDSLDTIDSDNLQNSSQDHVLCNGTTRQIDPSDLLKFSDTIKSEDIPDIEELQSRNPNEVSDMLKFSESQSPPVSGNVPYLSALLSKSVTFDNTPISSVLSPTESDNTQSTISNTSDGSTQNELSQFTPNPYSPYSLKSNMDIYAIIDAAILEDKKLVHFGYKELEAITHKFSEAFQQLQTGPVGKIGSGGFGDVYVGTHKNHGTLAVKKVRMIHQISNELETAMKIFNTEVKSLSHLRHHNIVPIFGYSIDGPTPCIVCKYIEGGSLLEKIDKKVLNEIDRLNIILGTAEGLKYIHHTEKIQQTDEILSDTELQSSKKSYYLHGDVKSANILLTKDNVPKLCDFGLAKQLDTTLITRSMMGTSAYMAPEGFSGTVTQKNDIFSFGIVLLELITGLKPIITVNGETINIKNYVEENCTDDITKLLDCFVPNWSQAQKIYELARKCLKWDKNKRPSIDDVCNILNKIASHN